MEVGVCLRFFLIVLLLQSGSISALDLVITLESSAGILKATRPNEFTTSTFDFSLTVPNVELPLMTDPIEWPVLLSRFENQSPKPLEKALTLDQKIKTTTMKEILLSLPLPSYLYHLKRLVTLRLEDDVFFFTYKGKFSYYLPLSLLVHLLTKIELIPHCRSYSINSFLNLKVS